MQRRLYFDTSVFGGVFDEEFSDDSIQLFERVKRQEVVCLFSEVVSWEIIRAPERVRNFTNALAGKYLQRIDITDDVRILASKYIEARIVKPKSYEDCFHIALATVYGADALISWDFKHIVNDERIKIFNTINFKHGFKEISIYSPKQFLIHEKEEKEII